MSNKNQYVFKPHVAQFIVQCGVWLREIWEMKQTIGFVVLSLTVYGVMAYGWIYGDHLAKVKAEQQRLSYTALRNELQCKEVIYDKTSGKVRLSDKCLNELWELYLKKTAGGAPE